MAHLPPQLLLLATLSWVLRVLPLLTLTAVRLLMLLPTLPAFVARVIATLLLAYIGRFVVGVASLLLVCHSKFSCVCSRVSHQSSALLTCIEKRERCNRLLEDLT
jgi:hypothetical protein